MAGQPAAAPDVLALLSEAAAIAGEAGRADLAEGLSVPAARVRRPGTVLCVVGEFKQGKSSLVNGLLDLDVCPVDDDLATSVVTIIHHAEARTAVVRRTDDDPEADPGSIVVEAVDPQDARLFVTEAGNPDNVRGVERLDLGVPSDLLADGLTLVDTPGVGGLSAGHATATLSFLPFADGLLFVSDASQELTQPELDLLREASTRCPLVLCVLTKTDLQPHWQFVAERNREHLAAAGLDIPVLGVAAAVRRAPLADPTDDLLVESGIGELLDAIRVGVVDRAKATAANRAARTAKATIDQLRHAVEAELAVLRDPSTAAALQATVDEAREHLTHLKGPGAGWRTVLADRTSDLGNRTTLEVRRLVREVSRAIEDDLEQMRSSEDWEGIARDLQARVATTVAALFASIDEAGDQLRNELVELLAEEDVDLPLLEADRSFDLDQVWGERQLSDHHAGLQDSLTAMRGAQSGVLMLGMMGRMLPAAAATLVASNPILLGAGLLLGGKALREQRARRVAQQRQEARTAIRQFLDDVQFELGPRLQEEVRALQREMRDAVADQITQLQAMWTETGRSAQAALASSTAAQAERSGELEAVLARLADLAERAEEIAASEASP